MHVERIFYPYTVLFSYALVTWKILVHWIKQSFRILIHYILSKLSFVNITTNVIIRKKFLNPLGRVFQNSNCHLKVQIVSLATKISVDFLKLYVFFSNIWDNDFQSCKFLLVIFPKQNWCYQHQLVEKQTYKPKISLFSFQLKQSHKCLALRQSLYFNTQQPCFIHFPFPHKEC